MHSLIRHRNPSIRTGRTEPFYLVEETLKPLICSCSPMCRLRSTNPMKIRRTRSGDSTFAAASPYRAAEPGHDDLPRRLAGYVVLAHDPAVAVVAGDYWEHSAPYYRSVIENTAALAGRDPAVLAAYQRLVADPTDAAAERCLRAQLADLLRREPALDATARQAADVADDNVYIGHFCGAEYQPAGPAAPTAGLDWRRDIARNRIRPTSRGEEVLVIIPIMDRGSGERISNLVACLLALADQTFPAQHYRITVVEYDTVPRWRHVIEPHVDHYVHVRGDGPFNKSWAVNVGVRQTVGAARTLCLLDADMLSDRSFLERNHARFADPDHDAHLPHTEMLSLDQRSSDRAVEERCRDGAPEASLSATRGLLLRDVPGACLWIRPETFHRVGGLDERYRGWGGEDEDMLIRTATAGSAAQCDDVLLHLAHPRPVIRREDGTPLNAHVPIGTWTGEYGYGDLAGPFRQF
jgi:hypothetical protein